MRFGKERSNADSNLREVVTVAFWNATNEAMKFEAPEVVRHPTRLVLGWVDAQQLSDAHSQLSVAEAVG